MTALTLAAYLADALILGTYAIAAATQRFRPFHWGNAVGGIPLMAVEVQAHAWPVLPITATFTALGWLAVLFTKEKAA